MAGFEPVAGMVAGLLLVTVCQVYVLPRLLRRRRAAGVRRSRPPAPVVLPESRRPLIRRAVPGPEDG